MSLICCKDVSMAYEGRTVLEHVNFSMNMGDYLCIIGENGSGKSTLMKGLLKLKTPASGSIQYHEGLLSNEIGYLPQQSGIQKNFPASVREVVLSGRLNQLKFHPFFRSEDKKQAAEQMERMGITHLRNKSFQELSGGQQQRVLLARALCATRKVLLLDEPVAGLDPRVTVELYELIEKINKEYNISIIMISHDISGIATHASHILHLNQKQLFFGTKQEYVDSDLGKQFLGVRE